MPPSAGRFLALLTLVSAVNFIFFKYQNLSLSSFNYLVIFSSNESSSQLYTYFPHHIDCDRIFAGDLENSGSHRLTCDRIARPTLRTLLHCRKIALHRPKLENDTLDMSCEGIQKRFSSSPSYHEPYPIAYGKTVYKDYQFLEQQMWNTYTRANWYCYSIDSKSPKAFRWKIEQLANCLPNVLISNTTRSIGADGVNQNYAHLDCMRTLESKQFEYIFLLQNHDIPTRTHREFSQILSALEGSTVVDKYPCPSNRCLKSYPTNLGKLGLCPKSFKGAELSACETANITYMKGGMQALLPKAASDFIVNEINSTQLIDMYTKKFRSLIC